MGDGHICCESVPLADLYKFTRIQQRTARRQPPSPSMFNFKRKSTIETAYACSLSERVASWSYHLMTVEDELEYAATLTPDMHRYACRELARQMAVLLFLPDNEFFQILQRQEILEDLQGKQKQKDRQEQTSPIFRLRACLQSCLQIFSREAYLVFSQDKRLADKFIYWQKVKEIVLMVLKRISSGCSSEHKITLLNGWFLDTCKLLDICLIYGKRYRTHVLTIIRNVLTRGQQLEDFQTDFRRVVDLSFLRLKELSEEFEGFAGIDFAALQEGSHHFQNFRNAEATLTKSLIKTLFSAYDLTCNLQAIGEFFPARCRVHLLEQALIFKRYIMVYNKLRYYDQQQWRFGAKTHIFRPLIDHLARAFLFFVSGGLARVAMLIRSLPPESTYRDGLKRTYMNFWYYTLLSPAISYEHRQDEVRLKYAEQYGKELAAAVVALRYKELFHPQTLQHFKRRGKSYQAIITAKLLGKQLSGLPAHKKGLQKMEAWRLPSFKQFVQKIQPLCSVAAKKQEPSMIKTEASTISFQNASLWSNEYDDQPQSQPDSAYIKQVQYYELTHQIEQELVQHNSSKLQHTTTTGSEREDPVGPFELDYSSICAASDHFMASGLSDSISEDSINSVSAMLAS